MPDLTMHFLFGEDIVAELSDSFKPYIFKHEGVFNFGAQGPDVLFFRRAISGKSRLPKLGSSIHEVKVKESFDFIKKYINETAGFERETLIAYFMGYIGHYFLDKTVHPYVFYNQARLKNVYPDRTDTEIHVKFEADMDSVFYMHRMKQPVSRFSVRKNLDISDPERNIIAKLYYELLKNVYGAKVYLLNIEKSFSDMINLSSLFYDRFGLRTFAADSASRFYGNAMKLTTHIKRNYVYKDVLNEKKSTWFYPGEREKTSDESVYELYQEALDGAVKAIGETVLHLDSEKLNFDTSLNFSGVEACDEN